MAEDRDLGRFLDVSNQFVGASGNDKIDISVLCKKLGNGVAGCDELDSSIGNLGLVEGGRNDFGNGNE